MTRVTVHVGGSRQMRTRSRSLRGPQWKAKWSQTRLISGWHQSGLFSGVVQSSRTPQGLLSGTPYCPPTCPPVHAFAFVKRTLQLLLLPALLCLLLIDDSLPASVEAALMSQCNGWRKNPNNHATNPKSKYSRNFCTESSSTTSSASPVWRRRKRNKKGRGG